MGKIKLKTKKRKMSQIWQGDRVLPITYLSLVEAGSESLAVNDGIKITAVSKGKGFAGVVKRHGFAGGPKTHGQSDRWRAPGSIGQTTTPGRVYKGKRMAGRMGSDRVSLKTVVLEVLEEGKILAVKGPVPGSFGQSVFIEKL